MYIPAMAHTLPLPEGHWLSSIMTLGVVSQVCLLIFLTLVRVWCRQILLVLALQLPHPHLLYLLWYATSALSCACNATVMVI